MATPHITGLGAYLLAYEGKRAPKTLCRHIRDTGDAAAWGVPSGTTQVIAYNGSPIYE